MNTASGTLGKVAGWIVAPAFGLTSFARHARTFHPRGETFEASVTVDDAVPSPFAALAERLVGSALVRFSGALWKRAEILDVLGCAIRLRRDRTPSTTPAADDQDLLFATIRRPWTMPFAPFTTDVHDYLANEYFAVSPFEAGAGSRVYLRLRPEGPSPSSGDGRGARLVAAVARRGATLHLEVGRGPFGPWSPLVRIALERVAPIDGETLRFRPFHDGRGVTPTGFVHALRIGVYSLSQRARP
jgi:hypothetical protein